MAIEQLRRHGEQLDDAALAARLNQLVRDGQAQLDFTGVKRVTPAFARALLDGLDLGRVAESLGADTMEAAVAQVFEAGGAEPKPAPQSPAQQPATDMREVL